MKNRKEHNIPLYEKEKRDVFRCKIGATGSPNGKSLFIIIPKEYCKYHNLSKGDIVEASILRKIAKEEYERLHDTSISLAVEQVKKQFSKARKLGFTDKMLEYAEKEAEYYLSLLTKKEKRHTRVDAIAATVLYVASTNFGAHITQEQLAEIFDVTTVTIRKHLHKAWYWGYSDSLCSWELRRKKAKKDEVMNF